MLILPGSGNRLPLSAADRLAVLRLQVCGAQSHAAAPRPRACECRCSRRRTRPDHGSRRSRHTIRPRVSPRDRVAADRSVGSSRSDRRRAEPLRPAALPSQHVAAASLLDHDLPHRIEPHGIVFTLPSGAANPRSVVTISRSVRQRRLDQCRVQVVGQLTELAVFEPDDVAVSVVCTVFLPWL